MMTKKLRILVSGMIAADPFQGGATWAVLQYVLGLRELGHEVWLVEPIRNSSLTPGETPLPRTQNAAYFAQVVKQFGLEESAALLLTETRETVGLSYATLERLCGETDLLINISGLLTDKALFEKIPCRVYLDLDPAFNQLWHIQGVDVRLAGHTHYVTVGQSLGDAECLIPTCGVPWIKTLQPVVLSQWPFAERLVHNALTTVANWRGYGSITYDQIFYGQKAHSFRSLLELPGRTHVDYLVALSIHPEEQRDLQALAEYGWTLLDPAAVTATPDDYRRFVQGSWAEIGIAKAGYVESRCGWFSDRSVCYLASGRPVIAQDTGFSHYLPTGVGLFAFETAEDVESAVVDLKANYARHAQAARAIAEEFFESRRVLQRLLTLLGVGS